MQLKVNTSVDGGNASKLINIVMFAAILLATPILFSSGAAATPANDVQPAEVAQSDASPDLPRTATVQGTSEKIYFIDIFGGDDDESDCNSNQRDLTEDKGYDKKVAPGVVYDEDETVSGAIVRTYGNVSPLYNSVGILSSSSESSCTTH